MEDKIKVLETKVKLLESIFKIDNSTIYNLNTIASSVEKILMFKKREESTEQEIIYKFTEEEFKELNDLIYTSKSKDLVSQNTTSWIKDLAKEKEIKKEILNGLI